MPDETPPTPGARRGVICLGELIVDLISLEAGRPLDGVTRFEKRAGGSAANVAVGLHHHGVPVQLWSKVGGDSLGRFLLEQLRLRGVSTGGVVVDPRYRTGIALVGLGADGDRHFEMHNTDSADQHLALDEVDLQALTACAVLHFGGVTLLGAETFSTTLAVLEAARAAGSLITFDPNIQIEESTVDGGVILGRLHRVLPFVDVLKMSADDWRNLLGDAPPEAMLARGVSLAVLTDGEHGARLFTAAHEVRVEAVPAEVVDAVGAGDAFTAGLLKHLMAVPAAQVRAGLDAGDLRAWGAFAARWASRILRQPGAVGGYTSGVVE